LAPQQKPGTQKGKKKEQEQRPAMMDVKYILKRGQRRGEKRRGQCKTRKRTCEIVNLLERTVIGGATKKGRWKNDMIP